MTPLDPSTGMLTVLHDVGTWDPATPTAGPLWDLGQASRLLDPALFTALLELARSESLLVATDYDGTIAPIVSNPMRAYPLPASQISLRALAVLPDTASAVISGRSLRDLAAMSRLPREVALVGSHGGETDTDTVAVLDAPTRALLAELRARLLAFSEARPGLVVEHKPTGAAIHFRGASQEDRAAVEDFVAAASADLGIVPAHGKEVVDVNVVPATKGEALESLRAARSVTGVLYIGDDVSDEHAFATLRPGDVGIKVAEHEVDSAAGFRVDDPAMVAIVLTTIFEMRRAWLFGRSAVPVERHSLLGNGQSVALVDPAGRVCWMPHPLPHSASIFSEILGSETAGFFSVAPDFGAGAAGTRTPLSQRYVDDTTVLETRWAGLRLHDYLASTGEDASTTVLVRVLTGDTPAEIRFCPRPDYGATSVGLEIVPDGIRVGAVAEPIELHAPGVSFRIETSGGVQTAVGRVSPGSGPVVLALVCSGPYEDLDLLLGGGEEQVRQKATGYWRNWVAGLDLPAVAPAEVARSAITLRALCHRPTGGVLAAATSSLPEGIGGIRNWDYRYCWIRDGSMTVRTLLDLGSSAEAEAFLVWLSGVLAEHPGPEQLHPLYAVDGSPLTTEAVLEHLPGYAGSRPVRVGNAAEHQVQLDVFGPVTELLADLAEDLGELSEEHWALTCAMVTAVERRWTEVDHGIWEARRDPKHNVYTKVMCWVTVDRAIRIADRFSRRLPGAWRQLREAIAEDVLTHGYDAEVGAFTVAYGEPDLDAACLFVGLSGMVDPTDPRFVSTVDAVERELRVGPTVFRYRYEDGLPGLEGGFHICTTWLIEAFILVGRYEDAWDLFSRLLDLMGPTGLLAEEFEPITEMHLGNHPQAYSHLGFVRVARQLASIGFPNRRA